MLQGKTVLITGSSSGIGAECARTFAAEGCKLILCARRSHRLEQIKEELLSSYPNLAILPLTMDVSDAKSVREVLSSLPPEFSEVDILINNAGLALGLDKISDGISNETIDTVLDTNIKGVLYVTREILPQMIDRKVPGNVIMIGSIAGIDSYIGGSVYSASKHALHAITETLRKELVSSPIRVTEIQPGLVETEFSVVRFGGNEKAAKDFYDGIEALSAGDIAEAVLFAATRRPNVQIASMLIFPTHQAGIRDIHRSHS